MGVKLSDKQEMFWKFYSISRNATDAALKAGYSKKTAYSQGQRLLKHVEISKRIAKMQEKTAEKLEISHDEMTRKLKAWIECDFSELMTLTPDEIRELPKDIRVLIQGFKPTKYGYQIDFMSKEKAIEMVNRHIGYYEADNEQKKPDTQPQININYNGKGLNLSTNKK